MRPRLATGLPWTDSLGGYRKGGGLLEDASAKLDTVCGRNTPAMTADPVLTGDGVLEWRDPRGRLHREDGPARVFPSGREEWFRHGRLHREGGPAVVHANGSVKWYVDGRRHRDDGPACVYVNGTQKWYRDGLRHRDDGPAAIYPDGRRKWFVDGVKVTEERA